MFSNSLKMIKVDRNMSELWQIACKKCNLNISATVGFIIALTLLTLKLLCDIILAFAWRDLQKPQETAGRTVGVSGKI
jgi:hypothetical protein